LPSPSTETSTVTDEVLITVENLTLPSDGARPLLDDISFVIHRGEGLGRAGVPNTVGAPPLPADGARPLLDDISFVIHRGEVLGIAGVEGNGQAELVESIMAMRPGVTGSIELTGKD